MMFVTVLHFCHAETAVAFAVEESKKGFTLRLDHQFYSER